MKNQQAKSAEDDIHVQALLRRLGEAEASLSGLTAGTRETVIDVGRDPSVCANQARAALQAAGAQSRALAVRLEKAEQAVRETEARFRHLADNAPMMIWTSGLDGGRLSFNQRWLAFTGRPAEREKGLGWAESLARDDAAATLSAIAAAFQNKVDFTLEYRLRRFDGEYRWILDTGVPRRTSDGEFRGYIGCCLDITERKRFEEALRSGEERYRQAFENDLSGVVLSRPDGTIVMCNPAYARLFGFGSVAEALAARTTSLFPDLAVREGLLDELRGRKPIQQRELELRRRDGSPVHVIANLVGRYSDAGILEQINGYYIDITERKKLEGVLRQVHKMEAVGRLAGGVAHDFNNLLTVVNGYGQLILESVAADDPIREMSREILNAGERAAHLTRQLLAFSRKQVLAPVTMDLNQLLADLQGVLRRLAGEGVELIVNLVPGLGPVKADPSQIEQALVNLVANARDVMPGGGKLTLTTRGVTIGAGRPDSLRELAPGRYALLTVEDTGWGMDEETRSRAFEPFFTTKEVGKGVGLGLASVYGIVKQSGGHVEVASVPGRGTAFSIYLPRVSPASSAERPEPAPPALRGTETILLVEDEPGVRALAAKLLRADGYTVIQARDGHEALALCLKHAGVIHLLVTDVVMPQMGGGELADRIQSLRPDTRVLFLSGYAEDAVVRHGIRELEIAFLQKPFKPEELSRKVRAVLDRVKDEPASAGR